MLSDWLPNACNRSESPLRKKKRKRKVQEEEPAQDTQRQFLATDRISITSRWCFYRCWGVIIITLLWQPLQLPRKNWILPLNGPKWWKPLSHAGATWLENSDVGDGWSMLELYIPLNNLNNRHCTSSRRNCSMLFVNNNMACGTWCSVLLCTIYIQHTVLASVWTHIAVIWMVHPEKNIP